MYKSRSQILAILTLFMVGCTSNPGAGIMGSIGKVFDPKGNNPINENIGDEIKTHAYCEEKYGTEIANVGTR